MYLPEQTPELDARALRESGLLDSDWYRNSYRDVARLGMDPAEHYLKYGVAMMRDPSPDFSTRFYLETRPWAWRRSRHAISHHLTLQRAGRRDDPEVRFVLKAAAGVVRATGDHARGIALAEQHLPAELQHSIRGLMANRELRYGSVRGWLGHLNAYLAHYGATEVDLEGSGPILSRLRGRSDTPLVTDGPLISVIMPAWNAEETLEAAAMSILSQTWQNVELLIVDDASQDGTWAVMQSLAARDWRVRIARSMVNVGPYVAKNVALMQAHGAYVTGHDADDWALPERLEKQVRAAQASGARASMTYMLRMQADGRFSHFTAVGRFSSDGFARLASISCMFEAQFLRDTLGYWDSVRFAADSEMISRAKALLGDEFRKFDQIGMICLDHDASLTNHPEHGIRTPAGLSRTRASYKAAWAKQHETVTAADAYIDFVQETRKYPTALTHAVPQEALLLVRNTVWHEGKSAGSGRDLNQPKLLTPPPITREEG